MRENIGLFRGKRIDNEEWVEGYFLFYREKPSIFYAEEWYLVDPDTVGECTGLKDKNGKLAFEHDITEDTWGRRWVVFGCEGGFGVCRDTEWIVRTNWPVIYEAIADIQNASCFSSVQKIIGNIHDNPELLKEGADK